MCVFNDWFAELLKKLFDHFRTGDTRHSVAQIPRPARFGQAFVNDVFGLDSEVRWQSPIVLFADCASQLLRQCEGCEYSVRRRTATLTNDAIFELDTDLILRMPADSVSPLSLEGNFEIIIA